MPGRAISATPRSSPRSSSCAGARPGGWYAAGAALAEAHPGLDDPWPLVDTIWAAAQAADHHDDFDQVRDRLDPGRAAVIERGLALPEGAVEQAQEGKAAYARAWDAFMAATIWC